MLVPVFAMYYRSRRIISAYNRNLATIQAQRRAEAHRIMQLAEESPEKLTRAERAAVEGVVVGLQVGPVKSLVPVEAAPQRAVKT
jgi:hypothetical protein